MGIVDKTHYWRGDDPTAVVPYLNPTAVVPYLTESLKQIQQSTVITAWSAARFCEISSAIFNDVICFGK